MKKLTTILIISDSEKFFSEVSNLLGNLKIPLRKANGGAAGFQLAKELHPDLIIIDLELRELDGIELCRRIKAEAALKGSFIVFYTGQQEEYVQIAGLNAGGDEYIVKPVKRKIFESRINALLKRKPGNSIKDKNSLISIGNLTIYKEQYEVKQGENNIMLPRKEFELLCLLAERPGKVFSRMELSNRIWGMEKEVKGRTIDVHVRKIREKLGSQMIRTVKGIGYKLIEAN